MNSIGVIFDLDGVIVDSADAHFQSWRKLGAENGVNITHQMFLGTFGRQNKDIVPIFFGPQSDEKSHRLAERKEALYRDAIRSQPPIVPGARELVRELKGAGVRLAIGSSAPPENIDLVLTLAGIADCFQAVVSAADVHHGKPDPEVYLLSCERLGLAPARCVVIEDAPVGVQAAKAAGAGCIGIAAHHSAAELAHADLVVARLSDIHLDMVLELTGVTPA